MPFVDHKSLPETPWRPRYRKWDVTRPGDGSTSSSLSISDVEEGAGAPLHVHSSDELITVLEGTLEVRLGRRDPPGGAGAHRGGSPQRTPRLQVRRTGQRPGASLLPHPRPFRPHDLPGGAAARITQRLTPESLPSLDDAEHAARKRRERLKGNRAQRAVRRRPQQLEVRGRSLRAELHADGVLPCFQQLRHRHVGAGLRALLPHDAVEGQRDGPGASQLEQVAAVSPVSPGTPPTPRRTAPGPPGRSRRHPWRA